MPNGTEPELPGIVGWVALREEDARAGGASGVPSFSSREEAADYIRDKPGTWTICPVPRDPTTP